MKLIDKERVVAEIEKRLDKLYNLLPDASKVENGNITIPESCNTGRYMALESFKKFLDTLEVKEVNLEKEKDDYWNKLCDSEFGELLERDAKWFDDIAKHFYELGLKVQKNKNESEAFKKTKKTCVVL